jgi:DNA repair protein RadD
MNRELWQHQQQGLDDLRATIQQGVRRVVMQAPTGAGKTLMAAAIVDGAIRKGNRLAFVVNAIGLIDQTVEAFYSEGIRDIGVIQANHSMTDWAKPVQVCSIQTLKSRSAYPEAKTVIFDEVHSLHDFHKQWLADAAWQNVPFIGLSATPWSKGLGKYFQSLLVVATTQELIDKGFLSKFKVYCTGQPDLSEVKVVAGEYVSNQLSDAMCKGTLTADIVDTWKRMWGKQNTIVFGVDRKHAETLHYRFQDIGVRSAYQDGETSAAERAQIKRDFHNGQLDVVCNIGTLTTGVDWDVRCLVLARPTKSEILYTQIIGRALRMATGKDYALILDHSNSTLELGLVTSIHHDHLDDGKPKKEGAKATRKKPLPRPCPQCCAIVPRLNRTCTECGHQLPLCSGVVERNGVLVPFEEAVKTKAKGREYTQSEKQLFYSQLLCHCQARGYKEGWAANKFREKFGVWPNHMSKTTTEVSFEVASWIKSTQIRWAKSKQNGQHLQAAE